MFCECESNYFVMNRGDTFELPLILNNGTELEPESYSLSENDKLYVGIMEPNQAFEDALIRKIIDNKSPIDGEGNPLFILEPKDTEYVLTGKYFIMVKLVQTKDNKYKVTTVLPMKEFFIDGTDKHISDKNFVTYKVNINGSNVPKWEQI